MLLVPRFSRRSAQGATVGVTAAGGLVGQIRRSSSEKEHLTARQISQIVKALSGGAERIHAKHAKTVWRVPHERHRSIVVKVWREQGVRNATRRRLGLSRSRHEYRILTRLHARGIPVPAPLGYGAVRWRDGAIVEALCLEDLGACTFCGFLIKRLVANGDADRRREIDDQVILITRGLVGAGICDVDHSINNIIVTASDRAVRVDFEIAARMRVGALAARPYARMLARLMGTYLFAVQPRSDIAAGFCRRLAAALAPRPWVWRYAQRLVAEMIDVQRQQNGGVVPGMSPSDDPEDYARWVLGGPGAR